MKPSFWTDAVMARVSYEARLFYIGLWNVADDAGWVEWDPEAIGAVLFPYETPKRRERLMTRWTVELEKALRLAVLDCGCAVIETLPRHQRISGKQSFFARDKHQRDHGQRRPLTDKHSSLSDSPGSGSGTVVETERNGTVARDSENPETTDSEFRSKVRPSFVRAA